MRRVRNRLSQLFLTLVLILVVFGIGTRIVSAEETEGDAQEIWEETENALMSEFDFEEIENSLSGMFPQQKISFEEVLSELITGNWSGLGKTFLGYLSDRIFYEFRYNRENLVYMLMVALTAAVFTNFSSAFQNRQVSEISFYVLYMLLITLCLTAFRVAAQGLEENLDALVDFMRVLCPSYFLAVAFASGSVTSLFFYNVILVLIYVVELVLVRFLLPVINVYIMIQVLEI